MKIIKYHPVLHKQIIDFCAKALEAGFTVVYPTDTCYGIACDPASKTGMKKFYNAKERTTTQPVHVIVADKAAAKKLKSIKSFERVYELKGDQIPFALKSTEIFVAPVTEGQKLEGQGMVFQKSFYDGKAGFTFNMQTGKTPLTEEELSTKAKSSGIIPEMNYAKNGIQCELVGIENMNGADYYVMKTVDGKNES